MSTQSTVRGAIARSISHGEIVTIRIDPKEDMGAVFNELIGADSVADWDYTDVTPALREVWGTAEGGEEWRVNIMRESASYDEWYVTGL